MAGSSDDAAANESRALLEAGLLSPIRPPRGAAAKRRGDKERSGGVARAQYLEPDSSVAPTIQLPGGERLEMSEFEQAVAEIDLVGFTVIEDVLSHEECAELLAVHTRVHEQHAQPSGHAQDGASRNLSNLVIHDRLYWKVCDHPQIMPLIDHFLGSDCILGSLGSRTVRPGDPVQRLHGDIPEHMLNLEDPVMMNTVWMLTDNGPSNGGTRIVPGSHRSMLANLPAGYRPPFIHQVTAPAGSVLVFNGQCWHSGGSHPGNGSPERPNLFAHYRKSYCIFQVDPHEGFPSEWWPDLSDRQKLLFRMGEAPGLPHAAETDKNFYLQDASKL